MKTMLAAPIAAILLAAACLGQDGDRSRNATTTTAPKQGFVLEPGNIAVAKLIDQVAEYLDYNILYHDAELANAGEMRITRRTEVEKRGCWQLFGSLLRHQSLAILTVDADTGFYEVISMLGPRAREITGGALFVPFEQVESYAPQKAVYIMTAVPLQNVNATIATNALRPFYASSGGSATGLTLGNVGNGSEMLVMGFGPEVAAACRLLKLVDVGDQAVKTATQTIVYLKHADAGALARCLDEVSGSQIRRQHAQEAGHLSGMPLRVVAYPELNSLILSGTSDQIRDAAVLIDKLDVAPSAAPGHAAKQSAERLERLEGRLQKLERSLRAGK